MSRGELIRVRLTDAERDKLHTLAKGSGMSKSAFLRCNALTAGEIEAAAEAKTLGALRKMRRELRRQGVNYWQIMEVCLRHDVATGNVEAFIEEQQRADDLCRVAEERITDAIVLLKKKEKAERRSVFFDVRVSERERDELLRIAKASNLTLSDVLRSPLAKGSGGDDHVLKQVEELAEGLTEAGKKYNVIAHTLNQAVVAKRRENVSWWLGAECAFEKRRQELLREACALLEGRL